MPVVTRIADLTLRTLTDYIGNYSDYLVAHEAQDRGAAKSQTRTGRGSRARQDVHRSIPLSGDESLAGPEPDQDAREGRPDRGPARAQEDPLHVSGVRQERAHRPRASKAGARRLRRPHGVLARSTCTSSAATASRSSGRTASGKSTLMRMLSARRAAGARPPHRRPQRRHGVLRAGRGDAGSIPSRPSTKRSRADRRCTWCPTSATSSAASCFPATTSTSRCGVLSGGERDAAGSGAHAAPAVEHLAARRADEPSGPRLQGSAARCAWSTTAAR